MAIPGGTESLRQRAGVVVGAGAIFTGDGEVCSGARSQTGVAAPTGITATSPAVMLGLAGSITPNAGGNVMITISGNVNSSVIADGASLQVSYGTGAAPANAGALAGTQVGQVVKYVASTVLGQSPFSLTVYVTGLVAGTAYWIDLAVAAITGGTATFADVNIVAIEL